jgi:GNAT superfamily N-acetyltransferase
MIRVGSLCLLLALPMLASAQAIKPPVPMRSFSEAEIAAVAIPAMAFEETPAIVDDFEKYFYFHRADTNFDQAFADISHCDELASGISYSAAGVSYYNASYGVLPNALGGAIGSAMADAIFGSAERRRIRRINIRNCMGFKDYARYGLEKGLWEQFHFEGSTVEPAMRRAFLMAQARVASGPKPTTKVLPK